MEFAKLAVVIIAVGVGACWLLALRQARLEAANELAEARLRIAACDERLTMLRASIAVGVTPEHVERMAMELGDEVGPLVSLASVPAELMIGGPEPGRSASTDGHPHDGPEVDR